MATADELLGNELGGINNLWFEVDLLARKIVIPKTITNLGAKGDEDVMHACFKLPRFYYSIDFADFKIGIDYTNARGEEDRYEPKDVTVTDDVVTFTWVVGRHAALYEGAVTFGLCAKRLNPDDPDDPFNEFHTTKASLPILDSMETCEEAIVMHTDLLEQWRRELFGIGDTEEAKIRAASEAEQETIANKGAEVLATIPADYQTAVSMVDNAERTKADAIVCSAQGEAIRVSDSSDDYLRGLKIFGKTTQITTTGKNLFDMDSTLNEVFTKSGDVYTARYDTQGYRFGLVVDTFIPAGQAIHFSVEILETNSVSGIPLQLNVTYENGTSFSMNADKTMTLAANVVSLQPYMHHDDINCYVRFKSPQLEYGSATTSYEPYTGGVASPSPDYPQELTSIGPVTVEINTKNLLPNMASTITHNGVTYTVNVDGSITAAGTASSDADSLLYVVTQYEPIRLPKGTYIASGINGGSSGTYKMLVYKAGWTLIDTIYAGEKEFTLEEPTDIFVYFWVKRGTGINTTFYPMIRLASIPETTYEPGKPVQSFSISTPNGLPGIPVTSGGNYTDSNGQQWVCDEIDLERGMYIQRIERLTLSGSEGWAASTAADGYYRYIWSGLGMIYGDLTYRLGMNTHFRQRTAEAHGAYEYLYLQSTTSGGNLYIQSTKFASVDELCAWLNENNVSIIYQLTIPLETPLTAEEIEWFRFAHTNFPSTTVLNNVGATMELKYNADTKTWLENLPKATDEQVQAAVDAWLTAHYANAEGVSF